MGRCGRWASRWAGRVSGDGCLLGVVLVGSVLSVSWSVYPFHCISFRGQFSISGRAISVRSRLLAWLTFLIHLIPVISSISSPRPSPRLATRVAGRSLFACRFEVGAARSSLPSIGLCRLIVFPFRCYCPRVGSPCPLAVLGSGYCACPVLVVMP